MTCMNQTVSQTKDGPTAADWDLHKGTITDLYMIQGKPLRELMHIMQTEHDFKATPKMYKNRFKWWGIGKNMRAKTAVALLTLREQRTLAGRNRSEYLVNGQGVSDERLELYLKRATRSRLEKAKAQQRKTASTPAGVVVRTPSPSPSPSTSQSQMRLRSRSLSPLDHRINPPEELRLPEEMLIHIRNFYSGHFEAKPGGGARSRGLGSFPSLQELVDRFDSQVSALAFIFIEPPSETVFRLLNCFYIEIRDQLREGDHSVLPMCLHNLYFLSTDHRGEPFGRMLFHYLKDGSEIYYGPRHPITKVWRRLGDACAGGGFPGKDIFCVLGSYINDRLLGELGEFNVLYLRILHHFTFVYSGIERFKALVDSQIAGLDALTASILGMQASSNPSCSLSSSSSCPSPPLSYPGIGFPYPSSSYSTSSSSFSTSSSLPTSNSTASYPPLASHLQSSAPSDRVDPLDIMLYGNEIKTILRGSLAFTLYISGRNDEAESAVTTALAISTAANVRPAVRGSLCLLAGNIAFARPGRLGVSDAVAHARSSLASTGPASSPVTLVFRLSRLAGFLEAAGDVAGARAAHRRVAGLLAGIGG